MGHLPRRGVLYGDIAGFDPDITATLAYPAERPATMLAAYQCLPEIRVGRARRVIGCAEESVMLSDHLGLPISHGRQEQWAGLNDDPARREDDAGRVFLESRFQRRPGRAPGGCRRRCEE